MTREEAIEIIRKVTFYWELGEQTLTQEQIGEALKMAIEALSSVTPKFTDAEIQKMQEMEQAQLDKAYELGKAEMQTAVLDTISELNAISFYEAQEDSKECYYEIRDAIKQLPPAALYPKIGHWIKVDNEEPIAYDCSECTAMVSRKYRYCPKCGAKMVEPQERSDKCSKCEYYINPDYTRCKECGAESEDKE